VSIALGVVSCGKPTTESITSGTALTETTTTKAEVSDNEAGEKIKLSLWLCPISGEDVLRSQVNEFNSSQEKIFVELSVVDWTTGREQIKQAVGSGVGPDMFYLGNIDKSYIDSNALLPLSKAGYSEEDLSQFTPSIQLNSNEGEILALPLYYDTYVLYYRKDILQKYGFTKPPSTWDELKNMAKTITEESNGEIMGFQIKGADDHLNAINLAWQTFLEQAGGHFMDMDTLKSSLNTPEGKTALEYMISFYNEGISKMGPSAVAGFREGKIAMFEFCQHQTIYEKFVSDANMSGKWGISVCPTGPKSGGSYCAPASIGINAKTEYPEACGEFLKFYARPESMLTWMKSAYGIPTYDLSKISSDRLVLIENFMAQDKENWDAILEQANRATPDAMLEQRYGYTIRWDAQKRYLIQALNEEISAEEALTSIDNEVNQSISQ